MAVPRLAAEQFAELCDARGLPCTRLGIVDVLEINLRVEGQFSLPIRELRTAWWATLRQRFE